MTKRISSEWVIALIHFDPFNALIILVNVILLILLHGVTDRYEDKEIAYELSCFGDFEMILLYQKKTCHKMANTLMCLLC